MLSQMSLTEVQNVLRLRNFRLQCGLLPVLQYIIETLVELHLRFGNDLMIKY